MNEWIKFSIEYANQRTYLDDLFRVYPTIPDGIRDVDEGLWKKIEDAYEKKKNDELIRRLLELDIFPIKDSYVAYLRRDKSAISRNPETVNRICGRLYEMGLNKIFDRCSEPKETNRQIGPMFKSWLKRKSLGIKPVNISTFISNEENAILDDSDENLKNFAKKYLGYKHPKGLDFVARFNKQYIIGEAKFLTDFGGHQNAQFNDAIGTLNAQGVNAIIIAILDGVLYIPGNNRLYREITQRHSEKNIMSALVLRNFLYQL